MVENISMQAEILNLKNKKNRNYILVIRAGHYFAGGKEH
jgi:hypothetical protein